MMYIVQRSKFNPLTHHGFDLKIYKGVRYTISYKAKNILSNKHRVTVGHAKIEVALIHRYKYWSDKIEMIIVSSKNQTNDFYFTTGIPRFTL